MKKVLLIFGTRPEAIKMAPLALAFKNNSKFNCKVCVTGQHREMLDQVLNFFAIKPDYDLNLMKPNQTLFSITADALLGLEKVLDDCAPDLVFVQGDTTTAFVGALASYYKKIDVAHLEAGLRSHDIYSPFPEEGNRILAGHLAKYHFTPTNKASENLRCEGVQKNIFEVGNTVIDALLCGLNIIKETREEEFRTKFSFLNKTKRTILLTAHRRESFGKPFYDICNAVKQIALENTDVEIIYPVHLNPNVQQVANEVLKNVDRVKLIKPLPYPELIWLMNQSYLVLTDSGGIQEEAPSLNKPVLVLRDVTERQEGVEAGTAILVGTNPQKIIKETNRLLNNAHDYNKMVQNINPYGDGTTCKKILEILSK